MDPGKEMNETAAWGKEDKLQKKRGDENGARIKTTYTIGSLFF